MSSPQKNSFVSRYTLFEHLAHRTKRLVLSRSKQHGVLSCLQGQVLTPNPHPVPVASRCNTSESDSREGGGGGEKEDGGLKELSSALHALVDEDAKDSTLSKQGIVTLLQ